MLNERQLEAVELFVDGHKATDIAKRCGVSRTTLYEWLKKDEFKREVDRRLQENKSRATQRISSKVDTYINELEKIALTSKSDKTRTDALTYLIDHVVGKSTTKIENINNNESTDNTNKGLNWDSVKQDDSIKLKVISK